MRDHIGHAAAVVRMHMREHDGIESSDAAIEQQRGNLRVSLTGVDEHSVIARSYGTTLRSLFRILPRDFTPRK